MNERSARTGEAAEPRDEPRAEPRADIAPPTASTEAEPRYVLGVEIARGGMGRVVDATDTVLGRNVALKEVLLEDTDARRRFAREIRITARLEHPSIVPVHDAGTTPEGTPFYVMRKVSGRPLQDLVIEAETLAARLALVPHVLAAAQAIAHAHERGVMHRDLKPSNILVGSLGETVVIDWGLAKVIGETDEAAEAEAPAPTAGDSLRTRIGTVFGTPGFMSPEQLRGDPVDAQSDVYALGATLYYVLARRPPHAAPTEDEMMAAALEGPPQAVTELAPGVPPELATIVGTALARDDRERYPSAAAVVEDLQRFLTGQLVASHRYSRRARILRFFRRNKLPVAISGLALVVIAVVAAISLRRVLIERNRADAALAEALDRNEQLVINQAQTLLASNPTAAVATAKALGPERWREARAIGMAARATGIARGYPAAPHTAMLALTEDGTHVIAAGEDGVIRLHDLVAHTTRELLRLAPELQVLLVDHDRRLVTWDATHVEIVELSTGARRALKLPVPKVSAVFAEGSRVWIAGTDGVVYTQGLDDAEFHRVPIEGRVNLVDAAPRGAWVAYGGDGIWLQREGDPPLALATGNTTGVDWADRGDRLAVAIDGRTIEITLVDDLPKVTQDRANTIALVLAAVRDAVYISLPRSLLMTTAANPAGTTIRASEAAVTSSILRLEHGYQDSLIAVSGFGGISVLSEDLWFEIASPTPELHRVAARSDTPFLVAATNGRILAWDLRWTMPEHLPLDGAIGYGIVANHQVVVQYLDKPLEWYDLVKRDSALIDFPFGPLSVISSDHEDLMAVVSPSSANIYRRDRPAPFPIESAGRYSLFTATDDLVVISKTGDISIYAPPAYRARKVFSHPAEPLALAGQIQGTRWLAAQYADGTLWRYDVQTGASDLLHVDASTGWALIRARGDVFFPAGAKLMRWGVDGTVSRQANLPRPIESGFLLDELHFLVVTDDHAGYDVRLDEPEHVVSRFPPGSRIRPHAVSSEIAITIDVAGTLRPTDRTTGVSWNLGHPTRLPFSSVSVSRDAQRIMALTGNRVLAWRQEVPQTPEATRAFLEDLTNAQAPTGAAALTWD